MIDIDVDDTRMPDPIDGASLQELKTTDIFVKLQRGKSLPEQYMNPDGTWPHPVCKHCDGDIEPGRLAIGRVLCFECQSEKEKREARGLR